MKEPLTSSQSLNVVIVCDLLSTFIRFRLPWAMRIIDLGHTVHVIVSMKDVDTDSALLKKGLFIHLEEMQRTSANPLKDLSYGLRIRKRLREIAPDRIIAYQAKAAVWTAIASKTIPNAHISILFPGLGYLFSKPTTRGKSVLQKIARSLYKFAFRGIDSAIFQNTDDPELLLSLGLIGSRTKIHVVSGSGVDCSKLKASPVPKEPIVFAMATRLLVDKGIREFAEAGRLVTNETNSVRFVIAGSFDSHPEAIRQSDVDAWVSEGHIEYAGHVADISKFLDEVSVFVLPSSYMEGTPRSILEALAKGRPVITTDHRGCRETVSHNRNGFLIDSRDTKLLYDAMTRFINQPELLDSMGAESRRTAEEKYDIDIVCRQMLAAIEIPDSNI